MSVQGIVTAAVLGALTIGTVEIRNEQARIILPVQAPDNAPPLLPDGTYGSSDGYGPMPSGASDTPLLNGSGLMRPDDMPQGDVFNPMPPGGDRPTRRVGGDWDDNRTPRPTDLPR